MVDTTLSPPAEIKPPFADPVPDRTTPDVHSQPWNDFFTKQADRIADLWSRMAAAEYAIAHMKDGVTDGSDAAPGQIGEYLASASPGAVNLVTNTVTNIVSLNLTAGDWDVWGNAVFAAGSVTSWSLFGAGVGGLDTYITATLPTSADQAIDTSIRRYSITATTTVWLVAEAFFVVGTGTMTASGFIQARRVR